MTTSNNEVVGFCEKNKHRIIGCLIKNQLSRPPYSHEGNIDDGLSYEIAVSDECQNDIKHVKQDSDEGYTKRDIVFRQYSSWEIKTAKSNLLDGKMHKCNWKKKNGNSGNDVLDNLPDYLLFYQKFSCERGIPALIGLISKKKLESIFNDKDRKIPNDSNVYFLFKLSDFEWHHIETEIKIMKNTYIKNLNELESKLRLDGKLARQKCFEENKTDETCICNRHEIAYRDGRRLKKIEKLQLKEKATLLADSGVSVFNISKEIRITPETIMAWLKQKDKSDNLQQELSGA